MARKKEGIPETDYKVGEKLQFKFNYIHILSYGYGYITARYGSGTPFVDKVQDFISRVNREVCK